MSQAVLLIATTAKELYHGQLVRSQSQARDPATFSADVLPILNSACVMCHMPGAAQAGISLYPHAYQSLVGHPSTQSPLQHVQPGDPKSSYLYRKLLGTHIEAGGNGDRMPFQGPQLNTQEMEKIRLWIESGANND